MSETLSDSTPNVAAEPAAPVTKKLTLGGHELELPADQADAIIRELNTRDGRHGTELQRLRQEMQALNARLEPPPEEPEVRGPTPPSEELLHENPREWQRQYDAYQDAKAEQRFAQMAEAQRQREMEQARAAQTAEMWKYQVQNFYKRHPEFEGAEDVVDAVYRREFAKYAHLPVDQALDQLVEPSRQRLIELGERGKAVGGSKAPVLESSRRRSVGTPAVAEPDKPETAGISRVVREMQARMRRRA